PHEVDAYGRAPFHGRRIGGETRLGNSCRWYLSDGVGQVRSAGFRLGVRRRAGQGRGPRQRQRQERQQRQRQGKRQGRQRRQRQGQRQARVGRQRQRRR